MEANSLFSFLKKYYRKVCLFFTYILGESILHIPEVYLKYFTFLYLRLFFHGFFKVFICYNIASPLCLGFLTSRHVGSQLTHTGIEGTPSIGRQSLTTGLPGKSQLLLLEVDVPHMLCDLSE